MTIPQLVRAANLVLILIVVDNGLIPEQKTVKGNESSSLNPYCSGQWSHTNAFAHGKRKMLKSLNPYCSGQWSHTSKEIPNVSFSKVS